MYIFGNFILWKNHFGLKGQIKYSNLQIHSVLSKSCFGDTFVRVLNKFMIKDMMINKTVKDHRLYPQKLFVKVKLI